MIATGGLLRMNRRQDSIRSKNRAENKRKRKARKRKKNDVVVVKGKLNLCSPAGLVAAVGVVVLLVGVVMAVLGYWPNHDDNVYLQKLKEPANGKMSYSKSPSTTWTSNKTSSKQSELVNQTNGDSGPKSLSSSGFLNDFLANYLYSDNLKVFGPLVMGIGIFLFICANAVLHENRDKKTKIINLRDIYSTVIDLHHIRMKDYSPINGVVNYSQTFRGVDETSGLYDTSAPVTRSSWPSTALGHQGELGIGELCRRPSLACRPRSWSRGVQSFTETVYSIYRDHTRSADDTPQPREWETTSIVTSSVNAFTLPVIKLNNCEVEEAERTEENREESAGVHTGTNGAAENQASPTRRQRTTSGTKRRVCSSMMDLHPPQQSHSGATSEHQGALMALPQGPQMQLLPPSPVARATGSRLSLNSPLSDQPRAARRCSLSVSGCRQGDGARRFSCPRLERSNSKGYIKLTDLGGESFEAPEVGSSSFVTDQEVVTAAAEGQGAEVLVTPSPSAEQ